MHTIPIGVLSADLKQTEKYFKYIKSELKKYKNIEVQFESTKESFIQGILARGDRKIRCTYVLPI